MHKEILSLLVCLIILYFIKDIVVAIIVLCVASLLLNIIFDDGKTKINIITMEK